jgi:hypothetical protein
MTLKYTKWQWNRPNGHEIYLHLFIAVHSKMYPNLDFWLDTKPSGNPASNQKRSMYALAKGET